MEEKHLLIGYKKDELLIKNSERHIKKKGGNGFALIERGNKKGTGLIRWSKLIKSIGLFPLVSVLNSLNFTSKI